MENIWKAITPLISFYSPIDMYNVAPCNVIFAAEMSIFFQFVHIMHLLTIISGSFLDIFTIYSPEINNFYQHKFGVMLLNNHEPFYVFVGLYFVSHLTNILSLNLKWNNTISQYSYTLLLGLFLYQQFDLLGINFLFWSSNSFNILVCSLYCFEICYVSIL